MENKHRLFVCPPAVHIDPRVKRLWHSLNPNHPAVIDTYIRVMETAPVPPEGARERHHLLSRCKFPQYEDLEGYPWNARYLSHDDHTTAHALLVAAFPSDHSLMSALSVQQCKRITTTLSDKTIDRIVRLLKVVDGKATTTCTHVANKIGVAIQTIQRVAKRHGIKLLNSSEAHRWVSASLETKLVRALKPIEGKNTVSCSVVARQYHVGTNTVSSAARRNGITIITDGGIQRIDAKREKNIIAALRVYNGKATVMRSEVAEKTGEASSTITKVGLRNNIIFLSRREAQVIKWRVRRTS